MEQSANSTEFSNSQKPPTPSKKKFGRKLRSSLNWANYVRPFLKSGEGIYPEYREKGLTSIIVSEPKCKCKVRDLPAVEGYVRPYNPRTANQLLVYEFAPESSYVDIRADGTRVLVKQKAGWFCPACGAGHEL